MFIKLSEIPEEGQSFHYTQKTGELNETLKDLIADELYEAQVFIKPLNSKDFELSGSVSAISQENCSRCGDEFKYKINEKFHEIMIPKQELPRDGKFSKVNHLSDSNSEDSTSVIEYFNMMFPIGEFLHEVIGLAIPFNPAPSEDENGKCTFCHIKVQGKNFGYNEEMPSDIKPNPFSVLKNLKIN